MNQMYIRHCGTHLVRRLLFQLCFHVSSRAILTGRFSREHSLSIDGRWRIYLFWNGLCMRYFWLCMNSILHFFVLGMCVLIYMIWVFPGSQRHYFQPLWTMWNRLNIHTHPWAQRVRPISNCHRTFIFIPHPESNIQWFLSQMWSILTKHTAIFSSSRFSLSLSLEVALAGRIRILQHAHSLHAWDRFGQCNAFKSRRKRSVESERNAITHN